MSYHPLMGISIFLIAVIISFFLGRKVIKRNSSFFKENTEIKSHFKRKKEISPPKGEITSPDAPWLRKENKNSRNLN